MGAEGTAQYRVRLVAPPTADVPYDVLADFEDATVNAVRKVLNESGGCSFTLPNRRAEVRKIKLKETEVEVYRNGRRIHAGVPLRRRRGEDAGTVQIQCLGLLYYFTQRHVGDANRTNHLGNGSFEDNPPGVRSSIDQWRKGPGGLETLEIVDTSQAILGDQVLKMDESRSIIQYLRFRGHGAAAAPTDTVRLVARNNASRSGLGARIDGVEVEDGDLVLLTDQNDSKYNGIWTVNAAGAWTRPAGYNESSEIAGSLVKATDGRERAGTGWKCTSDAPIDVDTDAINYTQYAYTREKVRNTYLTQTEPLEVAARRGSRWTAKAYFKIQSMDLPPHRERGLMVRLWNGENGRTIKRAVFKITADTEQGRWLRAEASVKIPHRMSDPRISVRLYCPKGQIRWDAVGLYYRERLLTGETDTAVAAKTLVEHAQDTAFGKSTLGIDTSGPASGVNTNKQYYHDIHANIGAELLDLTKGPGGIDFYVDEDTRTFKVMSERGTLKEHLALELGRNIASYDVEEDATDTFNTVVGLGPGEGPDREETFARRIGGLSGMVYEKVVAMRGKIRHLKRRAAGLAERGQRARTVLWVTTYERADQLIDNLEPGDRVPVRIHDDAIEINGVWRVTEWELDPRNDTLRLGLGSYVPNTHNQSATAFL